MGTCFSKKDSSSCSSAAAPAAAPASCKQAAAAVAPRAADSPARKRPLAPQSKQTASETEEDGIVKKEIFIIKHRKSHDRDISGRVAASPASSDPNEKHGAQVDSGCSRDASEASSNNAGAAAAVAALAAGTGIRTSSCTKEEVESILIQCGRLSHSNSSSGKPAAASSCPSSASRSRRYSGSKRSYDFDHPNETDGVRNIASEAGGVFDEDERQHHRQSRPSPRHGNRRRTPSRERDQQRSGSTERRRVSRSPGRRSEITSAPASGTESQKPGKLVSVPATVPSSTEPPSNPAATTVRRISVKRNVGGEGGGRSAASPRSQSPARAMEGHGPLPAAPPPSLSRNSSSRKAEQSPHRRNPSFDGDPLRRHEQSPYRRNPLSEIDHNTSSAPPPSNKVVLPHINGRVQNRNNKENERVQNNLTITQVIVIFFLRFPDLLVPFQVVLKSNAVDPGNKKAATATQTTFIKEETEKLGIAVAVAEPEPEYQKQQKLTRSHSGRRSSGNIDFSPETIQPNSYTNLLLEDIQNFHQTHPAAAASISLPACVAKAHSIFQAVADLNSNVASSEDMRGLPQPSYQLSTNCIKDNPFVESGVGVDDDLMEPSLHKYVTLKRGSGGNTTPGDREEIESSGSNSFMGSSSTATMQSQWEPGSSDSADCWTSSSASQAGLDEPRRKMNGKRRDGNGHCSRVRCR
ncbi:hypothetical protein SAY87_014192 [Trapa incisa]|uniref:Uncharacterized protein n=1 Tax=Trapa incisa TaxID=236973 RepID=A0AAN7JD68_9MYRT|nr:hypothetical protein SAY87_014192 [Trapa incisa]